VPLGRPDHVFARRASSRSRRLVVALRGARGCVIHERGLVGARPSVGERALRRAQAVRRRNRGPDRIIRGRRLGARRERRQRDNNRSEHEPAHYYSDPTHDPPSKATVRVHRHCNNCAPKRKTPPIWMAPPGAVRLFSRVRGRAILRTSAQEDHPFWVYAGLTLVLQSVMGPGMPLFPPPRNGGPAFLLPLVTRVRGRGVLGTSG
jgi:hypothetical protein